MILRLFYHPSVVSAIHGLQRTWFAVNTVPVLLSFALALALAHTGQFHELYISIGEQLYAGSQAQNRGFWGLISTTGLQAFIALIVLFVFSALIFISNAKLGGHRIEQVYQDFNTRLIDRRLSGWVNSAGKFAAALPWIGIVVGIRQAFTKADEHISSILCIKELADDLCAATHFSELKVASIQFDPGFQAQIKIWLWHLSWLPSFGWIIFWLAFALLCWEMAKVRIESALRVRRFAATELTLDRLPRTRADRRRDKWLHFRLVDLPYLQRSSGDFIIAAVAFITLADLLVPFLLENRATLLGKLPDVPLLAHAMPTWSGWDALYSALKPYSMNWLMPGTALGFTVLLTAWLGTVVFISFKRLGRRRPRWVDQPANIVAVGSGIAIIWIAAGLWGTAGLAITTIVFFAVLSFIAVSPERREARLHGLFWVALLVSAILLFAAALSALTEFHWVRIARGAGPLAIALLLALVIVAITIGMCHIGRHSGIPLVFVLFFVGLAVVANKLEWWFGWRLLGMLVFLAIAYALHGARRKAASLLTCGVALIYLLGHIKQNPDIGSMPPAQDRITDAFQKWLDARADHERSFRSRRPDQKYPIFIVAAEGGGIYAAAAVAAFMSRLQERCPSFAQHVLAISGVSGGAVGSVVFHGAVDSSTPRLTPEGCSSASSPKDGLQARVAAVIKDDHLSPLAGLVVPDILGTFSDRSWGLKESLDLSMQEHFRAGEGNQPWRRPFPLHWDVHRPAPALVLNTTWVRVGNRVVFAPFEFDDQSLVTLSTFSGLQKKLEWCTPASNVALTRAAVISARFPGVLPAYETRKHCDVMKWHESALPDGKQDRRWSFVDGGYIDASGAQTAQEIYSSIEKYVNGNDDLKNKVDLRLLLLTDAQVIKEEHGTIGAELRDLTAPVLTLFSVRSLLSRIATRETVARIDPASVNQITSLSHRAQLPQNGPWKVMSIELNHDDVQLELGWKLSSLTYDLVSLQLGQADLCAKAKQSAKAPREAKPPDDGEQPDSIARMKQKALGVAKTIRANSCVMASIEAML